MKTIIIGIAGGTGSGKTTLTEKLRDHFGANEVRAFSTTTATTSATTSCPMRSAASSTTTTRTALTRR